MFQQKLLKFFSLGLVLGLWAGLAGAAPQQVGVLAVKEGKAMILREGNTEEVVAGKSSAIFAKDTVQTLPKSGGMITLGEEGNTDEFTLGEKTTFVIEQYLSEPEQPTRGVFNLLGGKVRSVVNKLKGPKDIQMQTSSATIGVRGTDFLTEVPNNEITQVTTFEGRVALQNRLGEALKAVEIGSGFSSMVVASNAPTSPFELSRESLLESSRSIGRLETPVISRANARELASQEASNSFTKAQFDRIIEQAALVKGARVRVNIEF